MTANSNLHILLRGMHAAAIVFLFISAPLRLCASLPNILLVTSEDNGPDLGCYGDPFAQTPNVDRLAAESVRFERAFVTTASCSESRSSILTGLYPHQNGQIGLATHHYRMFGNLPNIPSLLKERGYRTGLIGKLHVNPEPAFPFDFRPNVKKFNTFSKRDVRRVADAAAGFFTESKKPFFLMVNYSDAHLPFLRRQHGLPETPLDADDVRPLPWVGLDTEGLRQSQADYYNCLSRFDTGMGMLLEKLAGAGLAEKTLLIYLGDHGAQFPRGKVACYESSLRIPLMIRWPGRIEPNRVRHELVSTVDLLPTILDAAGAPPPGGLAGLSLLPLLEGKESPWRQYLFGEYHGAYPPLFFPQRTVRGARYKLIANLLDDRPNPMAESCTSSTLVSYVSKDDVAAGSEKVRRGYATWIDAPPIELYDLEKDPHEWRNLAGDPELSEVESRLKERLRLWQKQTADPLANPENLKKLTAEHDALPKPYRRQKDFIWKYVDYLSPGDPAPAEAEAANAKHIVAVENVCAWPNLTRMPDGTIIAIIHNQPSHGGMEGELECWASEDGERWVKRGNPAPHAPNTVRMNHAAGLAGNGDLIVLCSGWTNRKQPQRPKQREFRDDILRSWICRSRDGGTTWSQTEKFPARDAGWSEHIPFGDIILAGDGSLRASTYQGKFVDETKSTKIGSWRSWQSRSDDDGKTWRAANIIGPRHNETSLFRAGGKRWLAAARIDAVELFASDDDGATWSVPQRVTDRNEINAHLARLQDGRLLLTYGNRIKDRYGVLAKLSSDEGTTWSSPIRLARTLQSDCGYPSSVQRSDGRIVTAYYAKESPHCDHYHMGVVIWDAAEPSISTR